jgi:transglutaminase-like putative cysteine protease
MRYRVLHETRYGYSAPVSLGHHVAHLSPADSQRQRCLVTRVEIDPAPAVYREWSDFFGNRVAYFSLEVTHHALAVRAVSEVDVRPGGVQDSPGRPSAAWEVVRDRTWSGVDPDTLMARQFGLDSPLVPIDEAARQYAAASFDPGRPVVEAVEDLMGRIHRDFAYDPSFSSVSTPLADVLRHRRGVCQDFAHLGIASLRAQGLAACYVSGYIETDPPPGGQRLVGADASHAWFAVFVPDLGWVDFDPTNNQVPLDRHITVARGRDYADVTPLKGVLYGGGEHSLSVAVTVDRIV